MRWLENLRQSTALLNAPARCVHIGDRESDIYELFCEAQRIGTHFLVRTCVDRLAGDGTHTIADEMSEVRVKGLHRIEVRDAKGDRSEAVLEIRYRRMRVLPPIGKQQRYPATTLHVIHAHERGTPKGRERIEWKLITDLPVTSRAEAIEKLNWYAARWKIETFHKILKSGCKAEDSKLRTAERLLRLLAVFCVLSWRIFWMTMINRSASSAPAAAVFTTIERRLLDHLVPDRDTDRAEGNPFHHTSPKWPGSAAILPAPVILRLATSSCGEGSPGLPISNWDLARRRLWVIERFAGHLLDDNVRKSQKVVNIRRNPKVALLVESGVTYGALKGVLLRGRAKILDDVSVCTRILVQIHEKMETLSGLADQMADTMVTQARRRLVTKVTCARTSSWDHAKLGGGY